MRKYGNRHGGKRNNVSNFSRGRAQRACPKPRWSDTRRNYRPPSFEGTLLAPGFHAPYADGIATISVGVSKGGGRSKVVTSQVTMSDCYRAEVRSLAFALENCTESGPVHLVTTRDMAHSIDRLIPIWRRNGWLNAKKEPVVAKESWQRIAALMERLDVRVVVLEQGAPESAVRLSQKAFDRALDKYEKARAIRRNGYGWN